jgi:hypothetical protein
MILYVFIFNIANISGKAKQKQRHNSSSSNRSSSSSDDDEDVPENGERSGTTHAYDKAKAIQAVQIVILDGEINTVLNRNHYLRSFDLIIFHYFFIKTNF